MKIKRTLKASLKAASRTALTMSVAVATVAGVATAAPTATAQIPNVQLPPIPSSSDVKLPEVKLPPVQLPQIEIPNVNIPGSSAPKPAAPKPAPKPAATKIPAGNPNAKPAPRINNGGSMSVYTTSSGRSRRYIINMPTHYNPERPAPVLFGFDGWRDSPENFRRYSRMHETGANREAIRVYPESINHGWEGAPYAIVRPGEDIKFVTQIIDELDRTYNIDRHRIYATGHSNGGGMTAVVACHLPHIFAGVAAVGGAFYNPVNTNCRNEPIPFLIMHGTGDTMMKFDGGTRHNGKPYLPIRTLLASYIRRNGCNPSPRITNIAGGKRHVYACSRDDLQLITNPQDHTWNRTPDASQEVWNFLYHQRK